MSNPKLLRTPLLIVGSWLALVIAGAIVLLVVSFASKPSSGSSDKEIKSGSPAGTSSSKGSRT